MTSLRRVRTVLFPLLLTSAVSGAARAQAPAELREFLRDVVKFSDADIAAVETGQVKSVLLPETDKGEIAAFGIVRVAASPDRLQALARDVKAYHSMEGVVQIARFSDPPARGDCDALVVPDPDIDAIKKCKSGECDVKVTDDMAKRAAHVDWNAPGAHDRVAQAFREMAVAIASTFRNGGIDSLGTIVDKKEPKSLAREFQRLLANSPYLFKYVKDFHDYLAAYPKGSFPGAESVLYWTKDTFSPKPVISINCQTVARHGEMVLIASQLVAASHYFNAGLDVTVGVPPTSGGGMYVVEIYRVRIDPPTGMMAGPAMGKVRGGIKDGVQKGLSGLATKLKVVR
jgi:hypothetical protein